MLVKLGNPAPRANVPVKDGIPHITTISIPDTYPINDQGDLAYDFDPAFDVADAKKHIVDAHSPYLPPDRQGITRFEDIGHGKQEAYLAVVHPSGGWMSQAQDDPLWVWSSNQAFGEMLARHYEVPQFTDSELEGAEESHWSITPPGVAPFLAPPKALISNVGRLLQSNMMGGGLVGFTGTLSSATSTTATSAAVTSVTANQYAGCRIHVLQTATGPMVYGHIISHTSGTTPVFTIDRWYTVGTPGAVTAATAPSAGYYYSIEDGGIPSAWYMGLSATAYGNVSDTALTGENWHSAGGLNRKICAYANTQSTTPVTWTIVGSFTGNGSDTYPLAVVTIATFVSMGPVGGPPGGAATLMSEATITSATLAASGDQLSVTDTWTGS